MRPVAFGEALATGTRLTLFSEDKPDRFFTVIKFWIDKTSGRCTLGSDRRSFLSIRGRPRRAVALPEAGGRQNPFTDSPDN
jgi:hypothetical protein